MKKLLFHVTLTFLVSSLIGIQTVDAQDHALTFSDDFPNIFFNMHISHGSISDNNPSEICFNFFLEDFNLNSGDVVTIEDEFGHREECDEEPCEFTWCYEIEGQYDMLIQCFLRNHNGSVYFKEGCIITIDPDVTLQKP